MLPKGGAWCAPVHGEPVPMKPAPLPDFELPIAIEPDKPASVPTLPNLGNRAVCTLLDGFFLGRLDHAAPLTDAEKAEALAIARAQIDADIEVIASFSPAVEAASSEAASFLNTYSLQTAALRLIHSEKTH